MYSNTPTWGHIENKNPFNPFKSFQMGEKSNKVLAKRGTKHVYEVSFMYIASLSNLTINF